MEGVTWASVHRKRKTLSKWSKIDINKGRKDLMSSIHKINFVFKVPSILKTGNKIANNRDDETVRENVSPMKRNYLNVHLRTNFRSKFYCKHI